ncbi:MAG: M23 family metallopeptidase [Flavobacteriaceae bacterium]|nr:M23 family metallopeptidase [Flavobacteriaceae bacterium]
MKKYSLLILMSLNINLFAQTNYPSDYFGVPMDIPLLVSGTFGELRENHLHSGIDLKTQKLEGFPVMATADGYISRIRVSLMGFGKVVYITHPNGYTTVYAHLQNFSPEIEKYIKNEQYKNRNYEVHLFPKPTEFVVKKGQVIGFSGSTGGYVDPHLHYEIRDTQSEKPINPLLFGLLIKDTIKPIIKEVVVYPLSDETQISHANFPYQLCLKKNKKGDYETDKIAVSGIIGIGISVIDLLNGANNENGIYYLELLVNGQLYHQQKFETFSYDETKYLNLLIDYERFMTTQKRIQKAFIDLNNPLSIINPSYPGKIIIQDGFDYKIEINVKDFAGNSSKVTIPLEGKNQEILQPKTKIETPYFIKSKEFNKFTIDGVTVAFPSNAFYEDFYFQYAVSNNKAMIHQPIIPLDKNYTLTFEVSNYNEQEKKQLFIAYIDNNDKIIYQSTTKKENTFYTTTKNLGTFVLMKDSIPPSIKLHNFKPKQWISKLQFMEIEIDDDVSGIDTYAAEINGEWILMEYDLKRKMLVYDFNDKVLNGHQHQFKIKVTDKVGNTNLLETTFYRVE